MLLNLYVSVSLKNKGVYPLKSTESVDDLFRRASSYSGLSSNLSVLVTYNCTCLPGSFHLLGPSPDLLYL